MRKRLWVAVGVCFVFLLPASLISQALFVAELDSAQEAAVFTLNGNVTGKGTGVFALNSDGTQLSYQVTVHGLSGPITGAHIHNAAAGVSGNVVKNLSFTNNTASGVWSSTDGAQPFTDSLLSELVRGRLYVNVHTSANGNGEIRGQILLKTGIGFTAKLDSAQEAAVFTLNGNVPGRGTFSLAIGADGQASYSGTVSALSGSITGSHIHNAAAGVSGGVIKNLTFNATTLSTSGAWASTDVTQAFSDVMVRELFRGRLYVNVHTSANGNGEIRGQLGGTGLVTSVHDQLTEFAPSSFRLGQNYPNPFNPTTVIEFDLRSTARVEMRIFNVLGQEVALLVDEVRSSGTHRIVFDGQSLPSGIYFYRISADGVGKETKKMILLR